MKEGDLYKYLGQDKYLGYVGPVNKKEWREWQMSNSVKSKLSAYNEHAAHNASAVLVLIPTFGLLN